MILAHHTGILKHWLRARLKGEDGWIDEDRWYEAIGFENAVTGISGAVLYHNLRENSVEALAAGEGNWLTPLRVEAIFAFPFEILGVNRMTTFTRRSNKKSRKFLERLGFKLEGVIREGALNGEDAFLYGMLKSECRWIKEHGKYIRKWPEAA